MITKQMIAPFVGVIVLLINAIFDVQIGEDVIAQITEGLVLVLSSVFVVLGIFKDNKKK